MGLLYGIHMLVPVTLTHVSQHSRAQSLPEVQQTFLPHCREEHNYINKWWNIKWSKVDSKPWPCFAKVKGQVCNHVSRRERAWGQVLHSHKFPRGLTLNGRFHSSLQCLQFRLPRRVFQGVLWTSISQHIVTLADWHCFVVLISFWIQLTTKLRKRY